MGVFAGQAEGQAPGLRPWGETSAVELLCHLPGHDRAPLALVWGPRCCPLLFTTAASPSSGVAAGRRTILFAPMSDFKKLITALKRHYGAPVTPLAKGPFELVLWENACYLLPDERRAEVFRGLRKLVGLTPAAILRADPSTLLGLAQMGGMRPETRVFRWQEIARITAQQFGGKLSQILKLPYKEAKKALKLFPTIGDPGAEKILMFCGASAGLPLESNGLRVLTRIGYGRAEKDYGKTYRSVQEAIEGQIPQKPDELTRAHLLLRQHGKETCKNTAPLCRSCPVVTLCAYPMKQAKMFARPVV
jgi:endonuclease III